MPLLARQRKTLTLTRTRTLTLALPRSPSLSLLGARDAAVGSGRIPGDFGLDPLKFCSTPEKTADMKLKEIVHCRLAMFAASGVITQAVLTGKGFPYF